jgi:hypothetical protein
MKLSNELKPGAYYRTFCSALYLAVAAESDITSELWLKRSILLADKLTDNEVDRAKLHVETLLRTGGKL